MTTIYFRDTTSGKVVESDEVWAKVYRNRPDLEELEGYAPATAEPATAEGDDKEGDSEESKDSTSNDKDNEIPEDESVTVSDSPAPAKRRK
jgi:hypothetical protein